MQKYQKESSKVCEFTRGLAEASFSGQEHVTLAETAKNQHKKLLDGPLRLEGSFLKAMVPDTRAPLIGSPVATSQLQQTAPRPEVTPISLSSLEPPLLPAALSPVQVRSCQTLAQRPVRPTRVVAEHLLLDALFPALLKCWWFGRIWVPGPRHMRSGLPQHRHHSTPGIARQPQFLVI